jgi:rod shape-determining protein MreC
MGDIFRSKFFIIFLIIACVLTITTMGLNIAGYGNIVSDAANTILEPFQMFANAIRNSAAGFADYFTRFNELREENAVLKETVRELEQEIDEAREIKGENEMLRGFFQLREERPDFKWLEASVIAGGSSNYISGLTINRGYFHGIEKDMAVLSEDGIVGYISKVDFRTATVSPFIRTENSVGAYIKRTGDTGLVKGDFELEKQGLGSLTPFSREVDIQVGDKIYSSGYGGMYPAGLFIGTVSEVYSDANTHTPAAFIEPGVNFNTLREVMIILEFDWVFD